jgi:IS5 family transposase
VTDAAVHDSQELDGLLDEGNTCNDVFADSAYRSAEIEAKLRASGYKSRIHRRGRRNHQAREVVITIERDGVQIQATSDGPAYILLPLQFSHCLVVVNGAAARLTRANLFETLMSFDRAVDARIEFRFGLFADNACRLRDGLDNKALGL